MQSIGSVGSGRESRRLKTREAADYVGLSTSTIEKLRLTGAGPPFLKLGKAVRYETRALDEWMASHQRFSTSDTGARAA